MILFFSRYFETLNKSFGALIRLLERPRAAQLAVTALLLIHSSLLAYSARVHSPTLNEPGHLVAGLSHWKFGRFELYRNNPPLVRMVAALPVMAAGYREDWSGFYDGPGAMPQFAMGVDFVAANGERSFFLFMLARWACIPFSWVGAIVCYLWARDLYGRPAGVVACSIWCFEPNILAHGSVIAPDGHATALGLAACYTFWRWLRTPTWSQAALTGVILGLAELTKTTLILFYPLWPIMWAAYRWPDRHRMKARDWLREAGMLAARMAIGLYVLNLGYGFEATLKPLGDFHFVSDVLTGTASPERQNHAAASASEGQKPRSTSNRFAGSWLGVIPVPLPANYLLGIDLQQRDFEHLGRPSYLRGEWRDQGWWYYYLYSAVIKVPLGLWLIGMISLIPAPLGNIIHTRSRPTFQRRDTLILLLPAVVIFVVASLKTGINEHMRYVLPAFPFVYIWISRWAWKPVDFPKINSLHYSWSGAAIYCRRPLIILMLLSWSVASSLWIFPHSLSYFNESIGGPLNGPKHLLGSNVDWGQDLLYFIDWMNQVDAEGGSRTLYLKVDSPCDYRDIGLRGAPFPQSDLRSIDNQLRSVPAERTSSHHGLPPGDYVISVLQYYEAIRGVRHGFPSTADDIIIALSRQKPSQLLGYSIYVFSVEDVAISN